MGKGLTGVSFLAKGKYWREKYLSGLSIDKIALEEHQHRQVISRCIWLARIPDNIKKMISDHPDIFSRKILVDTFAAKRRQCEKDGFKILRAEVTRLIAKGAGTKPLLKKTSKKRTKSVPEKKSKLNLAFRKQESMELENRLQTALGGMPVKILFDENSRGGEVHIIFNDDKSLEFIMDSLEDI